MNVWMCDEIATSFPLLRRVSEGLAFSLSSSSLKGVPLDCSKALIIAQASELIESV